MILVSMLICFSSFQDVAGQNRRVTKPKPAPTILSCGVCNQKALYLPKPKYPEAARFIRVSGKVDVFIRIDEQGSVESAVAVSGHPLFRAAAAEAALKAKFAPYFLGRKPVKVIGNIVYNFNR